MNLINTKGIYGLDAGLVDCLNTYKNSKVLGDDKQTTSEKMSKTISKYSVSATRNPSEYKKRFISYFNEHKVGDEQRNNRVLEFLKELDPKDVANPRSWNIDEQDKKYILKLHRSFANSRSNNYYFMQVDQLQKGKIDHVQDLTMQDIANIDRSLQHFDSVTINWNMAMRHCVQSDGQIRTDEAKKCYDFCKENGLKIRALGIVYPSEMPEIDLQSMSGDEILQLFENYMSELSSACPEIECMDVLNEMSSLSVLDGAENKSGEPVLNNCIFNEKLGDDYYIKMMEIARKHFPNTKMLYNGVGHDDPKMIKNIFKIVDKIQEHERKTGVKLLDGIGMQCRMDSNNKKVDNIQLTIDETRKRGLVVQVTEMDVVQCLKDEEGNELSLEEAEKRQADIYRQLHHIIFKNRDVVEGVTYGDMSDKLSWSKTQDRYMGEKNASPTIYDETGMPKQFIVDAINEGIQSGMEEYLEIHPEEALNFIDEVEDNNIKHIQSSPSARVFDGKQQKTKNSQTSFERQ